MKVFQRIDSPEVASILLSGGIGIIRTDTIYGVIARANDESAVEKVYDVKGRDHTKSPIVLIDSLEQLFDSADDHTTEFCRSVWPGKVSVIIPSQHAPVWIQRGNHSVAYRMPDNEDIRRLVRTVGPLAAPSANPEGQPPAVTIDEAAKYFGDTVDFYVDGGAVKDNQPSKLIRLHEDGSIEVLR